MKLIFLTVPAVLCKKGAEKNRADEKKYMHKWYPDYLLSEGKITQEQYEAGIKSADEIRQAYLEHKKQLYPANNYLIENDYKLPKNEEAVESDK